MSRNTPLPLRPPRTVRNLTACATCEMHPPDCFGPCACKASSDPIIACAKHDYCAHPDGPKFGSDRRPLAWPSRGLGDTVAKILAFLRLDGPGKVAKTHARKLVGKKGCGCTADARKLNALAPYAPPPAASPGASPAR